MNNPEPEANNPKAETGVGSTRLLGRVLKPDEVVLEGDQIRLPGNSWITANKTEHEWRAKDYIEVRRPNDLRERPATPDSRQPETL